MTPPFSDSGRAARVRFALPRHLLSLLLTGFVLAGCDNPEDPGLTPVTSGTIWGIGFTVAAGQLFQSIEDGPVYAGVGGATLVLDHDPATLGMTDPNRLQLRSQIALENGGEVQIAAFGTTEAPTGALRVDVGRTDGAITYQAYLSGLLFAEGEFSPPPAVPSAEKWVVTEFYAQGVPAYPGFGSGLTFWNLDDLDPAFAQDVLACDPGPAMQLDAVAGDRIAYVLRSAWLVDLEVVDQFVGPCE